MCTQLTVRLILATLISIPMAITKTSYLATSSSFLPMMMQCPELYSGSTVVDAMIGNIDIGPTIMHAAGLQTPEYVDGKHAADFPAALVVEEPINTDAH